MITQTTLESLLRDYHRVACAVDRMAKAQEQHAKKMAELATLAKTDQLEAQRQLRRLDSQPRVWDYGNTVIELRRLMKKSAKLLKDAQ